MLKLVDGTRAAHHYDVCVIGAGAAGLFLAAQFLQRHDDANLRVAVVDGANLDDPVDLQPFPGSDHTAVGRLYGKAWSSTQSLYDGELRGWLARSRPDYLTSSRLRALGGTSVVWSGWWLPLEEHDLRDPLGTGTAWPIDYSELLPYYRRVHQAFDLGPYPCSPADVRTLDAQEQVTDLPLAATPLTTRVVLFKRVNFRDLYLDPVARSRHVDLYPEANFVAFDTTQDGQRTSVDAVRVTALYDGAPGPTATITASIFVLAAGAVENTRILLLSGLGDQAGHCGRHLCDHPYLWTAAQLDLGASTSDAHPFFFSDRPLRIGPGVGAIGAVVPRPEVSGGAGFRALLGGADGLPGTVSLCWEQEATPGSRITLSDQLPPDPLGLPRVKVDADVADGDRRTPVEAITKLVRALEEAGLARARALPPLDHDPWSWRQPGRIVPGNHPMGTTRMSSRAEDGVVDPNARVHDTSNLYVLGSSVFPRGGYANPMLTVLALSARLADHIQAASTP